MRTLASLITVWDNKTHISSFIIRQREMASFWFIWPWINRLHGRNYFDSFILTSTANTMKFSHIFTFETFSWLVFLALVVCSSSKIVYKCDFGYPDSNEDCFAEIDDYAVVTTFPMTHDRKIIGALSDVSSISLLIKKNDQTFCLQGNSKRICSLLEKQTEDGNLCQIPYRNSVIGQDLYFCLYQLCPTSKTNSSKCFQGFHNQFSRWIEFEIEFLPRKLRLHGNLVQSPTAPFDFVEKNQRFRLSQRATSNVFPLHLSDEFSRNRNFLEIRK